MERPIVKQPRSKHKHLKKKAAFADRFFHLRQEYGCYQNSVEKNSTRLKKLLKLSKTASRTDVLDLTVLQYVEMGELSCLAHPTSCLVISTSVESLTRQLIRYKGSMQWFLVTKSDLLVIC